MEISFTRRRGRWSPRPSISLRLRTLILEQTPPLRNLSQMACHLFPRQPRSLLATARGRLLARRCDGCCESQRLPAHGQRAGGECPGELPCNLPGFFPHFLESQVIAPILSISWKGEPAFENIGSRFLGPTLETLSWYQNHSMASSLDPVYLVE